MKLNYFGCHFPVHHPDGCCRVCGADCRDCQGGCSSGLPDICSVCVLRALAIVGPPKRLHAVVSGAITLTTNPNILALALHNATGDWRRSLIRRRLHELFEVNA